MKRKRTFFSKVMVTIVIFSSFPAFAQVQTGWKHWRYDLNGTSYFPFPSTVQTCNKYNLNWTGEIGFSLPGRPILTGDVNGDGRLEVVHVVHTNMKIFDRDGKTLKQVTLGSRDCVVSFLADFDGDGVDDIFIQTHNDPNMRIYIYNGNGDLLSTIAKSSTGDPDIGAWVFLPNGKLIVNYKGRTGNNSRGLACWIYNSTTNQWQELWYYSIGPAYSDASIADADQDGKYEITLSTVASSLGDVGAGYNNNGTPTPDNQVYIVVVDEDGNEEFTLDYGGVKAFLYNYFVDFDHDGKYEILAVECHGQFMGSFPGTSKLHIIDYDTRMITKTFNGAENAHWTVAFADVNGDGIDEIIASNIRTGSFARQYILDRDLNILKSADINGYVTSINDINGDGKLEIILKDQGIIKILDNELNLLWSQQLVGKIYYAIFSDLDKNGKNELLVTANKLYNFEGKTPNRPPTAHAGDDMIVEANRSNGAEVTLNGLGSTDPDGDLLTFTWRENGEIIAGPTVDPTSEVILALGSHTVELTVEDGNGGTDKDEIVINVVDTTPPEIIVSLSPDRLWPPNHKMRDIQAEVVVNDVCDPAPGFILVSIISNEPDKGHGSGNKPDDIQDAEYGTADLNFQLRAERSGKGDGRIYEVTYSAKDASRNSDTIKDTVTVSHNMAKGIAIDFEDQAPLPDKFVLFQNNPNPFNPETEIRFQLPENSKVVLKIFNALGKEIRTLASSFYEAGDYRLKWDGRDKQGNVVSTGIYFYQIQAGNYSKANQMILIR